jgi:hypothetical protein
MLTSFEVPIDSAEEVYYNAGLFATRLRDGIVGKTLSEETIDRAFAALNRVGTSDDLEIQNQLQVAILEVLYDEWESYTAARQKLDGRALQLFEDVERLLRVPEPKTGK